MIVSYFIDKAKDYAFDKVMSFLKETFDNFKIDKKSIEESLNLHLKEVDNWSSQINFKDLGYLKKTVSETYIPLDLYLTPKRNIYESESKSIELDDIFKMDGHIIIIGHPGAGKSTSMKHICQKIILEEDFYEDIPAIPIVIRFRDFIFDNTQPNNYLVRKLYEILGISISVYDEYKENVSKSNNRNKTKLLANADVVIDKAILSYLDALHPIIILDGFDEIPNGTAKEIILKEIRKLFLGLKIARIILTSRTGEFPYSLDNSKQFEIRPLTEEQVRSFVSKWMKNDNKAQICFTQLIESPFFDTTIRPLTLAHLCAIFEREGNIPKRPKTVYRKVINLLLEDWNIENSIKRTSSFFNFETDRKRDFLSHLSYQLTIDNFATVFSKNDLINSYKLICENFSLLESDVNKVVNEIESHSGLFIQSGYDKYEFPHKSIQEYLTADFLVRAKSLPNIDMLLKMPNELAITVSLSSIPSDYFSGFILDNFEKGLNNPRFIEPFLTRLSIEKVEFIRSIKLGVAFAHIYHCCFYNKRNEYRNFTLQYISKDLLNDFYVKYDTIRQSLSFLKDYYTKSDDDAEKYDIADDEVFLKRNTSNPNGLKDYVVINLSELPKTIIMPQRYL